MEINFTITIFVKKLILKCKSCDWKCHPIEIAIAIAIEIDFITFVNMILVTGGTGLVGAHIASFDWIPK
jgi:hypothetical protein